ncbi:hypothetical protein SAMN04487770_12229 [Butyrivibrio sp. ob235]|uniref:hypothetical protein n=1 Tax=Butyrivibrio sp. ob235 TaxID=1761780 RepID=UPI0008CC3573|nr:hypothetical protein [Butyrivibrio sp. ob235]SEL97027.1 hypothetical protein SAMN04487770_12229 [Butyrivibrio sp. ob235]
MISVEKNRKFYSSSIVLIGDFSPMMFQPYWFKHCEILNDEEFNAIKEMGKTIISDHLTVFETENLAFNIEEKRFTIIAKKEPFEIMLDTFDRIQEKLDSVLIKKFGINFSFHVDLESMENFKTFGDVIAPKQYWHTLFEGDKDTTETTNGLASITMRKQTDFGVINVKLESSAIFTHAVFFNFNFHFDVDTKESFDILDVNDCIGEQYVDFANYADYIAQKLLEEVLADGK